MLEMYQSGDPYLAFAKSVGAVPQWATKKSHEDVRDRYKVMLLAVQYGMSVQTLAARLKISEFEAGEMLRSTPLAVRAILDLERRLHPARDADRRGANRFRLDPSRRDCRSDQREIAAELVNPNYWR